MRVKIIKTIFLHKTCFYDSNKLLKKYSYKKKLEKETKNIFIFVGKII